MNLAPKIGPLVAEIFSGFTAILLGYFALHGHTFAPLKDSPALAVAALTLFAWILGTFFDAVRNVLFEHFLDLVWYVSLRSIGTTFSTERANGSPILISISFPDREDARGGANYSDRCVRYAK
jgi:hypothetical protein